MENEELYRLAQAGEADAFERLHKQLANFIRDRKSTRLNSSHT